MNPANLTVIVAMLLVFYMFAIRPQQRRLKQHQELVSSIGVGDEVMTVGGMYGVVSRMDESFLWIEVADGVEIKMTRQAISRRIQGEDEPSSEEPEPGPTE